MKKIIFRGGLTAVAAACATFAGLAHAQSSVTLFGVLEAGMNYTSNAGGAHAFQMTSDDVDTSRWGMKGTEDLGGGLHAIFDLESAFSLQNGAGAQNGLTSSGNQLFGYASYVGLQSDNYGTVTVGHQYDAVVDDLAPLTVNGSWGGLAFAHPGDNDNTSSTYHVSNSIKYTSAAFNGLTGAVSYGFSNAAGNFAQNRAWSAGLTYTRNTLTLGAAYADLSGPGSTAGGTVESGDFGFQANNQKIWGLGANYGIGPVTLGAVYSHTNINQPTANAYYDTSLTGMNGLTLNNAELSVKYNITDALFVGGMYTYTFGSADMTAGRSSLHWNTVGLMAQYSLSKRTAFYVQGVYQGVSGHTGTALDSGNVLDSADASSTAHQMLARVAVMHTF